MKKKRTLALLKLGLSRGAWQAAVLQAYAGDIEWMYDMISEVQEGLDPDATFYLQSYHGQIRKLGVNLEALKEQWLLRFTPLKLKEQFKVLCKQVSSDEVEEIFEMLLDKEEWKPAGYPTDYSLPELHQLTHAQICYLLNKLLVSKRTQLQGYEYNFQQWLNYDS